MRTERAVLAVGRRTARAAGLVVRAAELVVVAAWVVWCLGIWLWRLPGRPPKPPGVKVVRCDPVFGIELDGVRPGTVDTWAGSRKAAFSGGPTEVSKVWCAPLPMRLLIAEAVRKVRAAGGRVISVQCPKPVDVRFRGEKVLPSGLIADLEIHGHGVDVVATIRVRLSVGAHPRRAGDPRALLRQEPTRVHGDCAPELVAVLGEQIDEPFGTSCS